MRNRCGVVIILILVLWVCGAEGFDVPETLVYRLMYAGIKVGESRLSVQRDGENLVIRSEADSSPVISLLYGVKDRVTSVLSMLEGGAMIPRKYILKLKEGGYRKDKEVTFFSSENRAFYRDYLENVEEYIDIPAGCIDPLTSIYAIRQRHLEVGKSEYIKMYDAKKFWNVEVQVLSKERVKTPAGEFDAILIRPLMESEGIFKRTGAMTIYVSDDIRRIPVKMLTKVAIGVVIAELVEIK